MAMGCDKQSIAIIFCIEVILEGVAMIKKRRWILWGILRKTHLHLFVLGFLFYFLLTCLLLQWSEPTMQEFTSAMWYCFSVISTIGFGDFTAETIVGRGATITLALYSTALISLAPGIVVAYYIAATKSS